MAQDSATVLAETVAGAALVLLAGAALIPVLRRLRQPPVIAEILAGIVLGPSLLGLFPGDLPATLFPPAVRTNLSAIAQVGILFFMFLIGWEADLGQIRARRKAVLGISLSAMVLPFGLGAALAWWLWDGHRTVAGHEVARPAFVLFIGTAMAITAFPVLARIIQDHRLQMTPVGILALASAAVGDALAWCMLAVVSLVAAGGGSGHLTTILVGSALYGAVLVGAVRPLLARLVTRMTKDGVVSARLLPVVAAGVFAAGWTTHRIGLDAIFGAFTFGLVMPRGTLRSLKAAVGVPLEHCTTLLLPIFFIATGLSVDVTGLGSAGLLELAAVIAVACLGKFGGTLGPARLSGLSWRDSSVLGVLMNTRGLTELIILNAGVRMGVLDTRMFTMMVLMALVTTAMAGPLVPRRAYARDDTADGAEGADGARGADPSGRTPAAVLEKTP
ncbi:cation:proton antiporter [Kitasatospora purpeofusca]|uniref:cation:proton antiporter domain-containing protein n=1 Tax=Kitasatospora purpeofusca TaxID=67352 RepID=UPI00386902E6|nr:cation:proton antiporter [Kitasatospora purpeofusca]